MAQTKTERKYNVLSNLGGAIRRIKHIKFSEGEKGEREKREVEEDKRMILLREYWRCPGCNFKVPYAETMCGECRTPKPPSALPNDREEIERLVRLCKDRLKRGHKGISVSGIGDLSLRELFMHIGVLLNELHAAKRKGLLD